MEKEFTSIEDIIASAQSSLNDFPIKGRFLITSVIKKMANNRTQYYFLNLKYKTGELNAKRFTGGELEFRSLNAIYLVGNIIEIEGIYQNEWQSMKIFNEKLIESITKELPHDIQNKSLENTIKKELARLKDLIKLGTAIQRKSYINEVIKPIFNNLSGRKIKQLKKFFEQEIGSLPIEKREEVYYDYVKTFERYENMQPSKLKKLGSNLFKLLSVLR